MGSTVNIGTPSNNTVSTAVLQDDSVTTAKIAASNVTATELGANAVITSKIADDAVTTAKIADDAVTGDKIATNLDLPDNNKIRFGTGNDLQIYHNSSDGNSYIKESSSGSGCLAIDTDCFRVKNAAHSENLIAADQNSSVQLFYDNVKKIETTSSGAQVTGNLRIDGHCDLYDDKRLRLGDSADLQIYHDGTDSYLQNTTGVLRINNDGTDLVISTDNNIHIRTNGTEEAVKAIANGAVELYHDNSKKFETTSAGVTISGSPTINGTTIANGHIRVRDHTGTEDGQIMLGAGNDMRLWHDGSNSYIQNLTGALRVYNHVLDVRNDAGNETILKGSANGSVELYYNNVKQLETHDDGVVLNGLNQATVAHNQYDNLVLGNAGGNAGMTIVSGTNNAGTVAWADGSSGAGQYRAYLEYYHDTERMHLAVNTSVAMEWRTDSVICHEHFLPSSNNSYNLGGTSNRWANIYTNDLHLSNEGSSNDVDGSWGDWTIQEGESDLFLKNNRSGKKYKFNLTEVK
jgi:hypothetical protein